MFSSSPSRLPKMTSSEENLWHLLIRAGMQKKLLGCTLFLSHRLFSFLIDSSLGKLFSSKNIKMQWPKDIPIQFYITITILPIFQTTISSSNGWWLVDGCHQNIGCGYKLFSVSTMFLYWHSLTNAMDNCSWNVSTSSLWWPQILLKNAHIKKFTIRRLRPMRFCAPQSNYQLTKTKTKTKTLQSK